MSAAARILVSTDVLADADLLRNLLRDEFDNVVASTDLDRAVQDFEKLRPEVLILAFNGLVKAERYYLGLYRLSTLASVIPHRTLILCNKDDLHRVYELCKKEYFDDYVLFWPLVHDAPRLPMAVHHALRQLAAGGAGAPTVRDFAAQARRLGAMESLLEQYAARGGERIDVANRSLQQARHDIGLALDGFSHQLSHGDLRGLVELKDQPGFQRELDRLKADEIATHLETVAAAVQPVREWAAALRTDLAPQFESARTLQTLAEHVRPVALLVDDDVFQHELVRHLLRDANLELTFATSGGEALAAVRRRRPDLILMDVDLPDIDGVETTRRIKSVDQFARVPVLMITGHSDKNVVVESAKAGASGFVVKPFNKEILLAKVNSCLVGIDGDVSRVAVTS
jgi:CheY-like chemotaxis protein